MKIINTLSAIFLAMAATFSLLIPPQKSHYHSLFTSTSLSDNFSVSHNLYTLTWRPHLAGTQANSEAAAFVLKTLSSHNIKSHIVSYNVSLSYPLSRSLTLTLTPESPGKPKSFDLSQEIYKGDPYANVAREVTPTKSPKESKSFDLSQEIYKGDPYADVAREVTPTESPKKLKSFDLSQEIYEGDPYADVAREVRPTESSKESKSFDLSQEIYEGDPYADVAGEVTPTESLKETKSFDLSQEIYEGDPYADVAGEVTPTFHAYAKSGSVSGPVGYVNYGRVEDFRELAEMGVNLTGCIVLARYGKIYRGDIVNNAFESGAIGAVVYTDRADYGGGGGGEGWFPAARWMPPSGVQVGSVYDGADDPSTPGWASVDGCERLSDDDVAKGGFVPVIPSLPVSWADGEDIMRSIGGIVAGDDWQGSPGGPVYRVGPGPGVLNLSYVGKQTITTIENVIGVIEGSEEPDRFVILGNHRDAWTFGAVDPNSGTATLLEVAQRLGKLQKKGWKPRRTIILSNWDAEEYGLIGSTEWVEDNRELLASRAVAYLNADCAVSGPGFHASATPQLDELLKQVAQKVQDPDNSSQTIYDSWVGSNNSAEIGRLGGAGSDYAAFVQHIGVPSADFFFGGAYPVYHSMYDDFVWMKNFGDPLFQRHLAAASFWGLVALRLADEEILPFNYLSYAYELQKCAKKLEDDMSDKGVNFEPLFKSIKDLTKAATQIQKEIRTIEETRGWSSMFRKNQLKVRELNDRLMMAERAFTDPDGLSGRPWYKHLIYAPSKHNDYGSNSFPGIDEAFEKAKSLESSESWHSVQHEVYRVSRAVRRASQVLSGDLT